MQVCLRFPASRYWLIPPVLLSQEDTTVHLSCTQTTDHVNMFWYLQRTGQGLALIVWSIRDQSLEYEKGFDVNKFIVTRSDTGKTMVTNCQTIEFNFSKR
uniref:Immunoglobulin V-set domain-containing protein n=1 Tax=Leptobrachium leishanense TaxID=445787 RepID=A0A8C5WE25_9ANUR